jgi:hypothetical protein
MHRPLAVLALLIAPVAAQQVGVRGEALPAAALGDSRVESMADVGERQRLAPPPPDAVANEAGGAPGEWFVPRRAPSGSHVAINRFGDLRMAIGFAELADVAGASLAAQGGIGSQAQTVQVIGWRGDVEIARTPPLAIGAQSQWFAFGMQGVDRIEFRAHGAHGGPAWYSLDDLTFGAHGSGGATEVVDFEDAAPRAALTGTLYRGPRWERGAGVFAQDLVRVIPPPRHPPGAVVKGGAGAPAGGPASTGAGTLPNVTWSVTGPKIFDPGSAVIPSDSSGAAGHEHFLSFVNSNLSVYRKDTKARVVNVALASFFALPPGVGIGDVRAVFDPHSQRFVLAAMTGPDGRIYLAVSLTSDPTGQWFKTSILAAFGSDADKWPDFPTLGVDRDGIYLAALMVGGSYPMTIWAIDKAPILQQNPVLGTVTAWRNLPWEGAIQPCLTYGDAGGEYLLSRINDILLRIRKITGPLTAPTLREIGAVAVPWQDSPPNAPALGSTTNISTGDFRPAHATWRAGSLWTAQGLNREWRAAVRWYQIDPVALQLIQSGTIFDPVLSYFHPSIAVNERGDALLAFNGCHAGQYVGTYYTGRLANDPPGEMAPPAPLRAGEGPYNRVDGNGNNRWGDYSYCSVDPSDDSLWTIQEYARTNNDWGTWIARMEFDWFRYGTGWPGTVGVPDLRVAFGAPKIGTTMLLWLGNSLGTTTPAVLLIGFQPASVRFFDGTLLVVPTVAPGQQVAFPGQYVPLAIPRNPSLLRASAYLQAVEIDAGASLGMSFTRGMELRIGQ